MSGGGGGGGGDWRPSAIPVGKPSSGGNGGSTPPNDPCALSEVTNVNSPDPKVVPTIKTGEYLDVVLDAGPPARILVRKGSDVLGSITSSQMRQLIECLQNGRRYKATVLTVRGGMVQVRISLA